MAKKRTRTARHDITPLVYSPQMAAPMIHPELSVRTLEKWRSSGVGPRFVKLGRKVGYTREALEEFVERQTRERTQGSR